MAHDLRSRKRISEGVRNAAQTEEHRERITARAMFSSQCRKLAMEGVPEDWLTLMKSVHPHQEELWFRLHPRPNKHLYLPSPESQLSESFKAARAVFNAIQFPGRPPDPVYDAACLAWKERMELFLGAIKLGILQRLYKARPSLVLELSEIAHLLRTTWHHRNSFSLPGRMVFDYGQPPRRGRDTESIVAAALARKVSAKESCLELAKKFCCRKHQRHNEKCADRLRKRMKRLEKSMSQYACEGAAWQRLYTEFVAPAVAEYEIEDESFPKSRQLPLFPRGEVFRFS